MIFLFIYAHLLLPTYLPPCFLFMVEGGEVLTAVSNERTPRVSAFFFFSSFTSSLALLRTRTHPCTRHMYFTYTPPSSTRPDPHSEILFRYFIRPHLRLPSSTLPHPSSPSPSLPLCLSVYDLRASLIRTLIPLPPRSYVSSHHRSWYLEPQLD